mmetsp:Transcript_20391/g.33581  ORF Transcript_20391/g.33581 Transcript_20391/m.33581 type:complete len:137 (-) Transcript_20391:82-492(-)|eukprot:scaffold15213_cov156-Skeletonema_menzelii.AAC.3
MLGVVPIATLMFPSKEHVLSSTTVTPSTPEATSSKTENNDHEKSPAHLLRSNIIDPVAMQLFQCRIEDNAWKDDQQSKSKTHVETKSLSHDPMAPSSDKSPKTELIRNLSNLSGNLSDVKSSEDMRLLARPIPRRV